MTEKRIPTEDEAIEAFYTLSDYMRYRCNKFKTGSCLGCVFLNRDYKYCLLSIQCLDPEKVSEEMIVHTIETNKELMSKPNYEYADKI